MANKLTRKRYNNLLTGRNRYFAFGDFLFKPDEDGEVTDRSLENLSDTSTGLLKAFGQVGGNLIGGELQSGVGDILSTFSSVAPGSLGTLFGVGAGIANRMFGSKMNTENIAKVESNINQLNSFQSGASDFDSLAQEYGSAPVAMTFDKDYIGKDGWFSNKVTKKFNDLNNQQSLGTLKVKNTLETSAQNLEATQMRGLLGSHMAFGGNLFDVGGPKRTNYDETFAGRLTNYAENPDSIGYVPPSDPADVGKWYAPPAGKGYDTDNRGMGIDINTNPHISGKLKKGKKGKTYLTEEAERQIRYDTMADYEKSYQQRLKYANDVILGADRTETITPSELKESLIRDLIYNRGPGYVARKPFEDRYFMNALLNGSDQELWDKVKEHYEDPTRIDRITEFLKNNGYSNINAFGGWNNTHGGDFSNGLIQINEGGTHEENPYEGVPMGMDAEGVPNLVEEGETVFNDYVFSKRLKVPKKQGKELLGLKGKLTFADAAKKLAKESEERPNDPISKTGLEDSMTKLTLLQEIVRAEKEMKDNSTNKQFARGGKLGRKYEGTGPFDQTLKIDPFPDSDYIENRFGTPLYTIPKRDTKWDTIINILNNQPLQLPELRTPNTIQMFGRTYDLPQPTEIKTGRGTTNPTDLEAEPTWMRKVPIWASGIMAATDALGITNKPDYGDAEMVAAAARNSGRYTPVSFNPISTIMPEQSIDRRYYLNRIDQNIAATARNILNTSAGNRASALSGLLAANAAGIGKTGEIINQIEEQNFQNKLKAREFNRSTESANSSGQLQAATANQTALANARNSYLNGILNAAQMRQAERQAATAARSTNLSNFINSLGDLGRENFARNMITFDPSKYYTIDDKGVISYKPGYSQLSQDQKSVVDSIASAHQDLLNRIQG